MSLIVNVLYRGKLDFPVIGSKFLIENNIGDENQIHIHFNDTLDIIDNGSNRCLPNMRFHFKLDEFLNFAEAIIENGRV